MTVETTADRRTREVLRRLELDVSRRLAGLLQGDYRGLVSGLGSEAGEAREYSAGDDVRRMDWNVTARLGEPHIRETVADRELATTVLVDLSPSLDFGTAVRTKSELAVSAVAAVGILTDRVGNRLGALILDGVDLHTFRSGSGRRHLLALLHRLSTIEPRTTPRPRRRRGTGADEPAAKGLADGIHRLSGPAHRGGLSVVISDLLSPGWEDPLRAASRRHDLLVIEVVDPRELELPDVGIIELADARTGELREIDTGNRKLRERYHVAGQDRLTAHADAVRRAGADHLVLRTDSDWVIDLARFVDRRRRNRRHPTAITATGSGAA